MLTLKKCEQVGAWKWTELTKRSCFTHRQALHQRQNQTRANGHNPPGLKRHALKKGIQTQILPLGRFVMRISCFCRCTDFRANATCPPFRHGMQEKKQMECLNVVMHLHIGCKQTTASVFVQFCTTHTQGRSAHNAQGQSASKHTSARFKRVSTSNIQQHPCMQWPQQACRGARFPTCRGVLWHAEVGLVLTVRNSS